MASCLEPAFSIVIAAVVLGELLRPIQVLGIVVVLSAIVVIQMPDKRQSEDEIAVVEPIE